MLFLKRLSDRFDEEVEAAVAAGVPREAALADMDEHQFAVPPEAHWNHICSTPMNLGEALNVAGSAIEEANAGRLDGVLGGTNWNDENKLGSPGNREGIIRRLLNHFSDLDLARPEPGRRGQRCGHRQCPGGRLRVPDRRIRR